MLPLSWRLLYIGTFIPLGIIFFILLLIKGCLLWPWTGFVRKFIGKGRERPLRLLCLAYMTEDNASARHRLYKYLDYINNTDIFFDIKPPADSAINKKYYIPWQRKGHFIYFIIVFFRRFAAIWSSPAYDAVFVQREIVSEFFFDPPWLIFVLRFLNKNIIYDVDDCIWMLPPHSMRGKSRVFNYLARLRFTWNLRMSRQVIVSNENLAEYAGKINPVVTIIPTLVDVEHYPVAVHEEKKTVVLGWTGGPGNLIYLKYIEKPLASLAKKYSILLRIICSRSISLDGIKIEFVPWRKDSEARNISSFDIGIMPLPDNEYTRGKAGFKILEYMAAGLPSVASPVGVNAKIIEPGITGYLAESDVQWESALARLIEDHLLRESIGRHARVYVSEKYDYSFWAATFTRCIQQSAE